MSLDIRIPTGLLFAIIGVILVCFGLTSDSAIYQRSLGVNVNLWWGLVLIVVSAGMLLLARRAAQTAATKATGEPAAGEHPHG